MTSSIVFDLFPPKYCTKFDQNNHKAIVIRSSMLLQLHHTCHYLLMIEYSWLQWPWSWMMSAPSLRACLLFSKECHTFRHQNGMNFWIQAEILSYCLESWSARVYGRELIWSTFSELQVSHDQTAYWHRLILQRLQHSMNRYLRRSNMKELACLFLFFPSTLHLRLNFSLPVTTCQQ